MNQAEVRSKLICGEGMDLFDCMVKASAEVKKDLVENLIVTCRDAGCGNNPKKEVSERAVAICMEQINHIANDIDHMMIPNEDWSWLSGKQSPIMYKHNDQPLRHNMVKKNMNNILDLEVDNAEYGCEEEWGVLPRVPYSEKLAKLSPGEKIAEKLWEEIFDGPRREEMNMLADEATRKEQANCCKRAVKAFSKKYYDMMAERIPQLR